MVIGIKRIVIHCSATPPSLDVGAKEIDEWHKKRGFARIGYNAVIRRIGEIEQGREEGEELAHARGYNKGSLAICLVGGVNDEGTPKANFTAAQWRALRQWIDERRARIPNAELLGHRDLPGVLKDCPCFDVRHWYRTGTIIDERKRV